MVTCLLVSGSKVQLKSRIGGLAAPNNTSIATASISLREQFLGLSPSIWQV